MNIGRSHISATVNTLVLAYVGASLPLLILFVAGGQDPVLIASGEVVAVEIIRALNGRTSASWQPCRSRRPSPPR